MVFQHKLAFPFCYSIIIMKWRFSSPRIFVVKGWLPVLLPVGAEETGDIVLLENKDSAQVLLKPVHTADIQT